MIKNTVLILAFFFISPLFAHSQLDLGKMMDVRLGETFSSSKSDIKAIFTQKPQVMKADFFGAYRIEYENVPFNYYGDANYTFQYAKDTLVSIKVEFSFKANDTVKFRRLYNTLLTELNADPSKKLLKQYSNLNAQKIFSYVKVNCITNTPKSDINYKPINTKFLGQNFWAIYKNGIYTGKFLRLYVQLIESHSSNTENGITTSYDGAKVEATLELTSEQLQDLKNKEEEMEVHSYKSLNEKTAPIKLKFQNGVYLVPVNLNNTLSIDFVLDLGASDVSISPDIFLVLYRAGTISESDFIGSQSYQFADGTIAKSSVFNIKSIQIGDREIKNIRASISNSLDAPLLLGQSALKKLDSYRIDNFQKVLIIE
jgi:predicted aspartyl protease